MRLLGTAAELAFLRTLHDPFAHTEIELIVPMQWYFNLEVRM